ncbi:hypothetical protein PSMA108079_04250 [Pseudoalteromonas mariniglutinosa]
MDISLQVRPHLLLIPFSLCKKLSELFTKRLRGAALKSKGLKAEVGVGRALARQFQ